YKGIIKNNSSYFDIGDEASMLKEEFKDIKISVGRDKVYSASLLEKENCDVTILDDGFQHWRLKRDLDIVAIDASSPLVKQKLLPLGKLREPLSSLKRADILFLTKIDMSNEDYLKNKEILHKINPRALVVSSVYEPVCFYSLKTGDCVKPESGKSALVLCGIANPLYFEDMVSKLQLKVKKKLIYPDHYEYKKEDLDFIKNSAKDGFIDTIVTTHKDAVRLKPFMDILGNIDILYLKIKLKIQENEEALHNRLLSVFNS
ncbi:MAG: tetraacyldisaccharide 4'-kinase, partial [Candidatus Omnitrophica bacterium]|nr:tetraacyldisaccharide 4'-kinase [Candidatus Omnitrophota bacterium]